MLSTIVTGGFPQNLFFFLAHYKKQGRFTEPMIYEFFFEPISLRLSNDYHFTYPLNNYYYEEKLHFRAFSDDLLVSIPRNCSATDQRKGDFSRRRAPATGRQHTAPRNQNRGRHGHRRQLLHRGSRTKCRIDFLVYRLSRQKRSGGTQLHARGHLSRRDVPG